MLHAALPDRVRAAAERLRGAGHEAAVVGGSVRDLLLGLTPSDFDLATSAAPEDVLALFPRAVPVGLRHGTVMLPDRAGPIDVTHYRGPTLADDLARRDFTINALALRLGPKPALLDPEGGHRDLAAGVLRAAGDPHARLAEDPLRTLRAARFVAQLGVTPDPALRAALPAHAEALTGIAGERLRAELERLLLAPHAGPGLELLREIGAERHLAPGARKDAVRVVAALPPELSLRLMGWFRDTDVSSRLRRLRFPRRIVEAVERRLALHPAWAWPAGAGALRKLRRRVGEEGLEALLTLARVELEAGMPPGGGPADARGRLARIESALAALRRSGALEIEREALAVGGAEVMAWLGCAPGPEVGRALRWLTERVAEDPARNDPAVLRQLLEAFAAERGRALDAPKPEG